MLRVSCSGVLPTVMAANVPEKRPRDGIDENSQQLETSSNSGSADDQKRPKQLCVVAKKPGDAGANPQEFDMPSDATVRDLVNRIAEHEKCEASLVTVVWRGSILNQPTRLLQEISDVGKVNIVYIVKKLAAPKAVAASDTATSSTTTLATQVASVAPASTNGANVSSIAVGQRVLLFMRHGQCCHEDEGDELKALTEHGHRQAESSAKYVASLFSSGQIPAKKALLHSTSRRARETAAKLPSHLPGLEVWNADILRETNPSSNPLRAEEVFNRLFLAPQKGEADTLIVVAHNNIILYLLMRAAGVEIERAAQSWRLFHLRHASVTRIDVRSDGRKHVVCIGAVGNLPHENVTWNNVQGADMSAWKGGKPERRAFSGRMMVLIRQANHSDVRVRDAVDESIAAYMKEITEYMVSKHVTVTCTASSEATAMSIVRHIGGQKLPQVLSLSHNEHLEATFMKFFTPPTKHSRETVVMVAEDGPVLYWLLRALRMQPEEALAASSSYCIGPGSITLVNVKNDGMMRVVAVGDPGHMPEENRKAISSAP